MPDLLQRRDSLVTETGHHNLDEVREYLEDLDGSRLVITVEIEYVQVGGLTPAASLYYSVIRQVFGSGFAMSEGPVVKDIAGYPGTASQHTWGNAVDVMVTGELHREVAYFTDANRGSLSIAHLIADPYFPSLLGDHYTHVHADFNPQYPI